MTTSSRMLRRALSAVPHMQNALLLGDVLTPLAQLLEMPSTLSQTGELSAYQGPSHLQPWRQSRCVIRMQSCGNRNRHGLGFTILTLTSTK